MSASPFAAARTLAAALREIRESEDPDARQSFEFGKAEAREIGAALVLALPESAADYPNLANLKRRVNRARNFPTNTTPAYYRARPGERRTVRDARRGADSLWGNDAACSIGLLEDEDETGETEGESVSETSPYVVTVRHPGCPNCGHGKVWQVAEDRDGAVVLAKTFRDEDQADDLAFWMNQAYARGFRVAKEEGSK